MVTLDVLSLLKKKGKTKYWLYHQLGMSYQNFSRMVNNETNPSATKILKPSARSSNAPPTTSSASPKIKTTADAVVFCRPAASAAKPPRRQSTAVLPSYAPHDSKARLQHESTRRDPWRSHVHRTRLRSACSSSSPRPAMSGVEGISPRVLLGV